MIDQGLDLLACPIPTIGHNAMKQIYEMQHQHFLSEASEHGWRWQEAGALPTKCAQKSSKIPGKTPVVQKDDYNLLTCSECHKKIRNIMLYPRMQICSCNAATANLSSS